MPRPRGDWLWRAYSLFCFPPRPLVSNRPFAQAIFVHDLLASRGSAWLPERLYTTHPTDVSVAPSRLGKFIAKSLRGPAHAHTHVRTRTRTRSNTATFKAWVVPFHPTQIHPLGCISEPAASVRRGRVRSQIRISCDKRRKVGNPALVLIGGFPHPPPPPPLRVTHRIRKFSVTFYTASSYDTRVQHGHPTLIPQGHLGRHTRPCHERASSHCQGSWLASNRMQAAANIRLASELGYPRQCFARGGVRYRRGAWDHGLQTTRAENCGVRDGKKGQVSLLSIFTFFLRLELFSSEVVSLMRSHRVTVL